MTTVCAYCRSPLGKNALANGDDLYCSTGCCDAAEYERKLREGEVLTVRMCVLDDGGYAVILVTREATGGTSEMTKNYCSLSDALRGVSDVCLRSAKSVEEAP